MRLRTMLCAGVMGLAVTSCAFLNDATCFPRCESRTRASSSLVDFLYPGNGDPPATNAIPELHVPLRVGLAFLPSGESVDSLDAAHKEQLLDEIRQRFVDRKFIREIVIVPDYYLAGRHGYDGLEGVQRLYGLDLMAVVSYDQTTHEDESAWSLGYLTIVGAYVLKGNHHDVSTLVDLAVVDPRTRSVVLRAGGVDVRHNNTTLIDAARDTRTAMALVGCIVIVALRATRRAVRTV